MKERASGDAVPLLNGCLQLFLLPSYSVLVDAYILQLAMYTELNCHNIYPPWPVHIAMEIEIVGSYFQ